MANYVCMGSIPVTENKERLMADSLFRFSVREHMIFFTKSNMIFFFHGEQKTIWKMIYTFIGKATLNISIELLFLCRIIVILSRCFFYFFFFSILIHYNIVSNVVLWCIFLLLFFYFFNRLIKQQQQPFPFYIFGIIIDS